jgi:hypothetical protein
MKTVCVLGLGHIYGGSDTRGYAVVPLVDHTEFKLLALDKFTLSDDGL